MIDLRRILKMVKKLDRKAEKQYKRAPGNPRINRTYHTGDPQDTDIN